MEFLSYINRSIQKYLLILLFLLSNYAFSKDNLPNIEEVCNSAENEIKDIELRKSNLKKEFKYIDNELEQKIGQCLVNSFIVRSEKPASKSSGSSDSDRNRGDVIHLTNDQTKIIELILN